MWCKKAFCLKLAQLKEMVKDVVCGIFIELVILRNFAARILLDINNP